MCLLQPAQPILGAIERAYFVRKWNQVCDKIPYCRTKCILHVFWHCVVHVLTARMISCEFEVLYVLSMQIVLQPN